MLGKRVRAVIFIFVIYESVCLSLGSIVQVNVCVGCECILEFVVHANLDVAVFAPAGAPCVLEDPEVSATWDSFVAYQVHYMVCRALVHVHVLQNARLVVLELKRIDVHANDNWPVVSERLHQPDN